MKLLIVANNLAGGGAEKVLLMLLEALKPPNYEIDLLLIKNKGVYLNAVPQHVHLITMIDVNKTDRSFPSEPSVLKSYGHQHIRKDYDVEVAFLEGPPTKLVAYHETKARKIAWVHTDLMDAHWTYPYYESDQHELAAYDRFDEIVFVSDSAKQGFYRRFGRPAAHCSIITNPTDTVMIQQKAARFSVPTYSFCFCSTASLNARKGQSRLLHAIGRLFNEGYQFHLNLVGDGDARCYYEELAHLLGISPYVHFLGFQCNPYPYMANCDVFILPSLAEGFPLVLCESLCLHRPIIATRCSGSQDVLQNGRFGMLTDNTEEGLYLGMKAVLDNPAFLSELEARSLLGAETLQYSAIIYRVQCLLHGKGNETI